MTEKFWRGPGEPRFEAGVESGEMLRQLERLLAVRYGAENLPRYLDGEDLDSDDPREAERWVVVYSELLRFTRGVLESDPTVPFVDGSPVPDRSPNQRSMTLRARIQELHLAYWTERSQRLRMNARAEEAPAG